MCTLSKKFIAWSLVHSQPSVIFKTKTSSAKCSILIPLKLIDWILKTHTLNNNNLHRVYSISSLESFLKWQDCWKWMISYRCECKKGSAFFTSLQKYYSSLLLISQKIIFSLYFTFFNFQNMYVFLNQS